MAVQSVQRTSAILLEFAAERGRVLGVSELARRTGLPKSLVHRTLAALVESGLIAREDGTARYKLGYRAVELALATLGSHDLRHLATPILSRLTDLTNETATLSLLVGDMRTYEAQVQPPQDVRMIVELGRQHQLYTGSSGRAILCCFDEPELAAYLESKILEPLTEHTIVDEKTLRCTLEQNREQGYAASYGERDPWAAGVAVPLFGPGGRVLGCVSVCAPKFRFNDDLAKKYAEYLKDAVRDIEGKLG